jgi:GTP-binding protein EngB required for normal cell division
MDLRDYEQLKFDLAEVLRSVETFVPRDRHDQKDRIRDLFSRLAEDRFNLVVVGRFSRGKTSLMNAVLATDRLPTGIRPLTSVITTVAYGSKEQAIIKRIGMRLDEEIPLEALPDYITEKGNSGNIRQIRMAEVQLPAELLRRGFYFVDTPGLGSPILANTRTTEQFLPEADAFVLVTSFESPLSDEELRTLRSASSRRVFVVVNKQDLASNDERAEALRYLHEQLNGLLGNEGLKIFSVSARDGLAAKRAQDAQRLAASGIPAFEEELVRFLIEEKSSEFLLGMCGRVAGLLNDIPPADRARLGGRIEALSKQIGHDREVMATHDVAVLANSVDASPGPPLPSCEVCGHVGRRLFDFLSKFQYDITIKQESQRALAQRGGLCSFHTWQYESVASPQGTCIGYPALLDDLAARLSSIAASAALPADLCASVEALLPQAETCVLCGVRAAAESEAITFVAGRLQANPDQALPALSAFCLPHFRLLAAAVPNPQTLRRLLLRQAGLFQRLSEDMRRFALKQDGVRRYLCSDEETTAANRALLILAGHRTVNTPVALSLVPHRPSADPSG